MIKFATIGTSFVTRWFLDAAKRCEGVEYAAVYSRSRETAKQFAEEYGGAEMIPVVRIRDCGTIG